MSLPLLLDLPLNLKPRVMIYFLAPHQLAPIHQLLLSIPSGKHSLLSKFD
ncbi:unnamed protein product [Hymenolepis diminuta]|uniref:Uncharacterized protein n=1 Tax=Hymenolepis diminuta TaxID=6216 RepID=A0A0R3SP46_HYMDI|nr:unnamed protein product [Hymenolepis diminuta]